MSSRISRPRRAAQVTAIALGLVALGLGLATAPLDALTHQAGAGNPWAEALFNAAALAPSVVIAGLVIAVAASAPGLVAVAGHDVQLNASGDLSNQEPIVMSVLGARLSSRPW